MKIKLKIKITVVVSKKNKETRQKKQMTQQQLVEKAGLHLIYIDHLEAGKYHPSVFVLWKIARVLDISLDNFI